MAKEKESETTKPQKCHTETRKQQRHNAETKAPPSQEPRDHRVRAARGQHSHRYLARLTKTCRKLGIRSMAIDKIELWG